MEMQEYDFTLKFKLQETHTDPNDYVEALEREGCDDALVGVGSKGKIGLNFIRFASSEYQAIYSAIRDVKKAIPNAILTEVMPFSRIGATHHPIIPPNHRGVRGDIL